MESIWRDIRYEARALLNTPLFTIVVLITLFLAVGANTVLFSVVRAVLLQPLPFPEPDRLVWVTEVFPEMGLDAAFGADYLEWRAGNEVFEDLAAYTPTESNLRGEPYPIRLPGTRVSQAFFSVLGIQPALGRAFTDDEDQPGGPATVILSHGLWRDRFGGRGDILGSTLVIDGEPVEVTGIMPANFDFPKGSQLWTPLALNANLESSREQMSLLRVIGRLKSGVTYDRARSDLELIHGRITQQFPDMYEKIQIRLSSLSGQLVSDARSPLLFLLGAVILLLLIACANLTALLLVRGEGRRREMGLRAVLGATRAQLTRQSFIQGLLLALAGGLASLAATPWLIELVFSIAPQQFPRIEETRVDGAVLAFTLGVSLVVALLCGVAPALAASRTNPGESLRDDWLAVGKPQRLRQGLVIAQATVTLVLLSGAGLLLHSLWRLTQVDPGFDSSNVLTVSVKLASADYPELSQRKAFLTQVLREVESLPGVRAVAASNYLPLEGPPLAGRVEIEGREDSGEPPPVVGWFGETPGFSRAMGIELLEGRALSLTDRSDSPPVAVVNQQFARLHFGGESPIGRRFKGPDDETWITIVGMIRDTRTAGLEREPEAEVHQPLVQLSRLSSFSLVLRSVADPGALASAIRERVSQINPNQPLQRFRTLDEILRNQGSSRRFSTTLLSIFAALALGLAALGLYGLIAYSVAQRTREIGIRISLGASHQELIRLFVRQGLVLILIGVALGVILSVLLSRFVSGLLWGVSSVDPATLAVVSLFFVAVGSVTCLLAAWRVSRLDPCTILRCQ